MTATASPSPALSTTAPSDQRLNDAFGLLGVVAEEFRRAGLFLDGEPDGLGRRVAGTCPGSACLGLLALHRLVEAVEIDRDAALAQRILSQVERKAVACHRA